MTCLPGCVIAVPTGEERGRHTAHSVGQRMLRRGQRVFPSERHDIACAACTRRSVSLLLSLSFSLLARNGDYFAKR